MAEATKSISDQKRLFAIALFEYPTEPFKAARAVFGDDTGTALEVYGAWVHDPEVLQFQKEYKEKHGQAVGLASKEDMAREIYNIGINAKIATEDRLRAFRLYAEVRGFIAKPPTITGPIQVNNDQRKIMVITRRGESLPEWELNLKHQQRQLTADNE